MAHDDFFAQNPLVLLCSLAKHLPQQASTCRSGFSGSGPISFLMSALALIGHHCLSLCDTGSNFILERLKWLPTYKQSPIEGLERQRQAFGIHLQGLFAVFLLRLLTGDLHGAMISFLLLMLGNFALSELQHVFLSCFVGMAVVVGFIDATRILFLLQFAGNGMFPLIALPMEQHLHYNVVNLSVMLAPFVEFGSARAAWCSYLVPSMLPQPGVSRRACSSDSYHSHAADYNTMTFSGKPCQTPASADLPGSVPSSSSNKHLSQTPQSAELSGSAPSPSPSKPSHATAWYLWALATGKDLFGASQSDRVYPTQDRSQSGGKGTRGTKKAAPCVCAECGKAVDAWEAEDGRGTFTGKVYCTQCWHEWAMVQASWNAPSEEPTLPSSAEPAMPSAEPTLLSKEPALPSARPALPSAKPTLPAKESALPSEEQTLEEVYEATWCLGEDEYDKNESNKDCAY